MEQELQSEEVKEVKKSKAEEKIEQLEQAEKQEAQAFEEWKQKSSVGLLESDCYFESQHYVTMIARGKTNGVIIKGSAGLGKSTLVRTILNNLNIEYAYAKSHSSPAALYVWLFKNKEKICIIDDVSTLMRDKRALEYMKAALETEEERLICNMTQTPLKDEKGKLIPNKFNFTGSIIILLNKLPTRNPDLDAVISRVQFVELDIPMNEVLRLIGEMAKQDKTFTNLTLEEKQEVVNFIQENYSDTMYEELNFRTFIKMLQFRDYAKEMNDENLWTRLAKRMLKQNDRLEIVKSLEENESLTAEERVKKFIELNDGKGSKSTYYRIVEQLELKKKNGNKEKMSAM